MRLGVLFSGGKDSCYALFKAMKEHDVACLLTVLSNNPESYMFHTANINMTEMQAKAIGLPLITKITKGIEEEELDDLKVLLNSAKITYKIDGIVTGAIASVYQATRIQNICDELGLWCFNPLWQLDQLKLLDEIFENGFDVIVSGIAAYPLDEQWLGMKIDRDSIKKLVELKEKYRINPSGEGGEIETFVLSAPMFRKSIKIIDSEKTASGNSGIFNIKEAKLE